MVSAIKKPSIVNAPTPGLKITGPHFYSISGDSLEKLFDDLSAISSSQNPNIAAFINTHFGATMHEFHAKMKKLLAGFNENLAPETEEYFKDFAKLIAHLPKKDRKLIYSKERGFIANTSLGNLHLNMLGLHIFRMWKAKNNYLKKRNKLLHKTTRHLINANNLNLCAKQLDEHGFVVIENFLDDKSFKKVSSEIKNAENFIRANAIRSPNRTDGETEILQYEMTPNNLPETEKYYCRNKNTKLIVNNLCGAINRTRYLTDFLTHIEGVYDGNKEWHIDTFQPTHKWWLYLDDVKDENGPFNYIPGSHKLSPEKGEWCYIRSCRAAMQPQDLSCAFRVEQADLEFMKMPGMTSFAYNKNTLIFADTSGIHRRGQGQHGMQRNTIFSSRRLEPF